MKTFIHNFRLITLLCFGVLASCKNEPADLCEKETYLLPKDFKGIIIVFFDQEDGSPCEYEGEARLYKIPPSGLLKSQFRKNGGCMTDHRIRFFYPDSLTDRKELLYFMDIENNEIPLNENYVMLSFLPDKQDSTAFVIHLVGEVKEFVELTNAVKRVSPHEILKSMNANKQN
jgi:hypothetical protein